MQVNFLDFILLPLSAGAHQITSSGIGARELDLFAGLDNHEVGGPS